MAKEEKRPTATDKGKGKVQEKPIKDSKDGGEVKKDKDGKPVVNGKKGDEPQEGKQFFSQN